jgi:hypothetical protein
MLIRYYTWLPAKSRAEIAQRFTELVQQFAARRQPSDLPVALAAFQGLARLASSEQSVTKINDPETLDMLTSAYIAQVKQGDISRYRPLETELGISPTIFHAEKSRK